MKRLTAFATLLATTIIAATAQNTADFSQFTYTGNDIRFQKQYDPTRQYLNPIIAGYAPDPSICRKGDTYYLVNSSFSFFPGVPIYKSQDLVNWQSIGHVLNRDSQLPLKGQRVSGGIYAPAITYNERNKTFYMITTNVGAGNFYVKTTDPEKGWSEPIYLPKVGGIDPSFFFDKNGKAYIVNNDEPIGGHDYNGQRSIMIHEFSVEGDSVIGEQKELLRGGTHVQEKPIWIEGPHLFKEGKYYYLMCAEGGTGEWHSEVILRSKNPMGPYEECPYNPILTQRTGLPNDRPDYVSSAGHADLVKTPKGQWWAVFLACRPYDNNKFYNTGRDTYLLPVTWKDGWPTILEKGIAIPTVNDYVGGEIAPQTEATAYNTGNFSYTESFNDTSLGSRWMTLRNIEQPFYTVGNGKLSITPKAVNIRQRENLSAVFVRQQHTTFTATTTLRFNPTSAKELAGFALLQNENYHFTFGKTLLPDGRTALVLTRTEKEPVNISTAVLSPSESTLPLQLKIEGDGGLYDFYYAVSDGQWQLMARGVDATNLTTNRSGGFIGACIGLYATKDK